MFSEKERQIYRDPGTLRFYDPLALKRALLRSARGRFNEAIKTYGSDASTADEKAQAEAMIVLAGREAFGLKPIDPQTGEGVVDAVVIDAVTAFTRWLKGKDETAQSGPNSVPCTGCP